MHNICLNIVLFYFREYLKRQLKVNDEYGLIKNLPNEGKQKTQPQQTSIIKPYQENSWTGKASNNIVLLISYFHIGAVIRPRSDILRRGPICRTEA